MDRSEIHKRVAHVYYETISQPLLHFSEVPEDTSLNFGYAHEIDTFRMDIEDEFDLDFVVTSDHFTKKSKISDVIDFLMKHVK